MFKSRKMQTRTVVDDLGWLIIRQLWDFIADFAEKDYLIVIKIKGMAVELYQEQPEKRKEYSLKKLYTHFPEMPLFDKKLYAIDDEVCCTICYPQER